VDPLVTHGGRIKPENPCGQLSPSCSKLEGVASCLHRRLVNNSGSPARSTYTSKPYAVRTHAPPAAFIFFSADFEKNLAFTIIGCGGRIPFPNTLNTPDCVKSTTGATSDLEAFSLRMPSGTNVQILSKLIVGQWYFWVVLWKYRIPTCKSNQSQFQGSEGDVSCPDLQPQQSQLDTESRAPCYVHNSR
jgi:hypothetical protein